MAQRWVEAMAASRNWSARASRAKRPRWFTKPPRLVETVTSGEVVTMASASGPPARARSLRILPNATWVDCRPLGRGKGGAGPGPATRGGGAAAFSRGERTWRRGRPDSPRPSRGRPAKGSHSSPAGTPIRAWKAAIWVVGHQAGVVVLVALERQAEALDGVDDEELGPLVAPRRGRRRAGGPGRGRRGWSSARPGPRRRSGRAAATTSGSPPRSARMRARQAAPPWKVRAA